MNAPDTAHSPPSPRLANDDLLPVGQQRWTAYNYFAMWMSDVHSVGGYVFAAGLFFLGLSGWQILLAMMVGIFVVNKLLDGVGVMGQRLGVPYPVIARLSFGVFGANLPAVLRAIVGIVWYGIQTWLASTALVIMVAALWPDAVTRLNGMWLGLSELGWICMMTMWTLQLLLFWRGMEWVRCFIDFCGPAVYLVMFALAAWMLSQAGWGALTLSLSDKVLSPAETLYEMLSVVALVIAYFAALLLNFADFSRFGSSEKAVRRGNFLGLPVNFLAFALVTVAVTASTVSVFGEAILDPIHVVQRIDHPTVLVLGCLTFVIATIGINIVANFVSAAYDIANIAPKHITFWRGGVITAVLSVLVMPWSLYHNPIVINLFIGCLGACLGPLFGVIITDYYAIARRQVDIDALYSESPDGAYWYHRGVNHRAVLAFVVAAAPSCAIALWPPLARLAPFAWIIGTLLAAALYGWLMKDRRRPAGKDGHGQAR